MLHKLIITSGSKNSRLSLYLYCFYFL